MTVKLLGLPPRQLGLRTLFRLVAADMTLTTDQVFVKLFAGSRYVVTDVVGQRISGAFGVACSGGIYTGAAKTGLVLLSAAQTWAALTGADTAQFAAMSNVLQTSVFTATPLLSLTTGNTGALVADILICGIVVD